MMSTGSSQSKLGRGFEGAPFRVLGVRFDPISLGQAVQLIEGWIESEAHGRTVAFTNIHGVTEACLSGDFRTVLDRVSLSLPDGMPIVWVGRLRGVKSVERVSGPDLMMELLRVLHTKRYSHYFYGGAEGVAEGLGGALRRRFPTLKVAGCYSPPFRPLTGDEDRLVCDHINSAAPDFLWVGLGCPKQEIWMRDHADKLSVPVILAVGQAFDIYAGRTRRAPAWMGNLGLEWLFRLTQDPRRLMKRYFIRGFLFAYFHFLEIARLRKF